MSVKSLCAALLVALVAFLPACDEQKPTSSGAGTTTKTSGSAAVRCPHEIKKEKCPFCNPRLIESDGFCGEHGVAEAMCVQCRSYLKAAFRAKGDWCKNHDLPDSQCVTCHPELKEKIRLGEHGTATPVAAKPADGATCEHGIAQTRCPFCTPSLIQSDGFCKEHNIDEALCVKCRPYLEVAFKAKKDWCAEHSTPESQCAECNPALKNKPTGG